MGNEKQSSFICACVCVCVCVCAQPLSRVWLFSSPVDCSLPGPFAHGIFQARLLEWGAISYSNRSSQPKDRTHISWVSCIGR